MVTKRLLNSFEGKSNFPNILDNHTKLLSVFLFQNSTKLLRFQEPGQEKTPRSDCPG